MQEIKQAFGVFLATEAILIASHVRLQNEIDWSKQDYEFYARTKAGLSANCPG